MYAHIALRVFRSRLVTLYLHSVFRTGAMTIVRVQAPSVVC